MAKFQPYACSDPSSVIGGRFGTVLVLAQSFCAVRAVRRVPNMPDTQMGVRDILIPERQLKLYTPLDAEKFPLHSLLQSIKEDALTHGAEPEAVMLIGQYSPFTKKELKTMAEKLTKKGAAKKPATKKAAAKTDAAGGGARSTLDPKAKITATEKGTKKLAKVDAKDTLSLMIKAKTVGKALEGDVQTKDIHYAVRTGLITVG